MSPPGRFFPRHSKSFTHSVRPSARLACGLSATRDDASGAVRDAERHGGDSRLSSDPNISHHPRFLMLDQVAMEHPVAGIIGDKGHLHPLARRQKHRVGEVPGESGLVGREHREAMPVNVDGVKLLGNV